MSIYTESQVSVKVKAEAALEKQILENSYNLSSVQRETALNQIIEYISFSQNPSPYVIGMIVKVIAAGLGQKFVDCEVSRVLN